MNIPKLTDKMQVSLLGFDLIYSQSKRFALFLQHFMNKGFEKSQIINKCPNQLPNPNPTALSTTPLKQSSKKSTTPNTTSPSIPHLTYIQHRMQVLKTLNKRWVRLLSYGFLEIMQYNTNNRQSVNKYMKVKTKKKKQTKDILQKVFIDMAKRELERKQKFYLVGITGRTSFILENSHQFKFKITIGNQLKCSCPHKENMHCVHTLYVLTEIFYLPNNHTLLEQCKYSNTDLRYIVASRIIHTNKISDFLKSTRKRLPRVIQQEKGEDVEDQPENVCAICQTEIVKRDATTNCQSQCNNTFHLDCFTQWAKHQMQTKGFIKCPLCRDLKPAEYMKELRQKQYEYIQKKNTSKIGKEFNYYCDGCQLKEIQPTEPVFKCIVCEDVTLCASCYNLGKHFRHSFICKNSNDQKWRQTQDRKAKKKLDEQAGLIKMKLPQKRRFFHFLAGSLPCYFSKNTRWNIIECKKLDIKIQQLECIACNDKQKAFLRKLTCGHFIHHRCLRRRIQKGKLFCRLDGQKFLQGYDSLIKHQKLNKDVQNIEKIVEEQESQQQQKYEKNLKASPSRSISIRTETQSSQTTRRKIKSVKAINVNRSFFANQSFNNPE